MMQSLLADRFKLVVRRDSREMATYVLEMARQDKSLGSQMRRSTIDCSTTESRERARATLPQGDGRARPTWTAARSLRMASSLRP